jgi:hypothetical protein
MTLYRSTTMSKLSRTIITVGTLAALALAAPLLARPFHDHQGDREARHGHHGHMMVARAEDKRGYRHEGRRHEHRADMTDEERKAYREEMRVRRQAMRLHWDTLSDAEKDGYKEQARMRIAERRAAWEAMSPEEREAKRQEMRQKREEGRRPGGQAQ